MKNRYLKLKSIVLTSAIALTGCSNKNDEKISPSSTKNFDVGKHTISVPIKEDIRQKNFQYEYHDGYEIVGISLNAYGKVSNIFGGGTILYSNVEEVTCSSIKIDDEGKYLYTDFGTPLYEREEQIFTDIKEFKKGEHVISIPIVENNINDNFQYEYHEGYEVIGIATTSYGKVSNFFGGGVLLYKNIVPVKCSYGKDGYTSFGIPIEIDKTLEKH